MNIIPGDASLKSLYVLGKYVFEYSIKDDLKEEKSLLRYLISLRELLKDFCIMSAIIIYYFD